MGDDVQFVGCTAFDLDHVRTGAEKCGGCGQCGLRGGIGLKGQISQEERAPNVTCNTCGMVRHLRNGHRHSGCVPLDNHAQRVADKNKINPIGIQDAGKHSVIGSQHRQLAIVLLGFGQSGNSHGWQGMRGFHRPSP